MFLFDFCVSLYPVFVFLSRYLIFHYVLFVDFATFHLLFFIFYLLRTHTVPDMHTIPYIAAYNTGNIDVGNTYTMVCTTGYYIFVSSAFYGYSSTCFDTDPLSDVRVACQGKNTNCTITFNDATFGGDPCSAHSVTKYGSATMSCVGEYELGKTHMYYSIPLLVYK